MTRNKDWKLQEVEDVETTLDDSGLYVIINRVVETRTFKDREADVVRVRADLMKQAPGDDYHEPIVSFIGSANAVRKHLIRFLDNAGLGFTLADVHHSISREHASYIGYELLRAETDRAYVQD